MARYFICWRRAGDPTLQTIISQFREKFGLDVNMITLGKGMMYDSGAPAHRPRLAKPISEARTLCHLSRGSSCAVAVLDWIPSTGVG